MKYFDNLPKLVKTDAKGNSVLMTNLMARASVIPSLMKDPSVFYQYDIQDGDTPEIVASKYYDDPNRFWLVTYSNQILDPVWNWPMTYSQFLDYIDSKYEQDAADAGKTPYNYTKDTVYAYQKIINTTDNYTHDTTKNVVSIDQSTYNTLIPSTTTYTLPDGETCTIEITKNLVTLFDYEYDSIHQDHLDDTLAFTLTSILFRC